MMRRGLTYRRQQRVKAINRKKRICHNYTSNVVTKVGNKYIVDISKDAPMEWYYVDGKYDKGKIHCGCPLCKPTKGYEPSLRDKKLKNIANKDIKDYFDAA